MTKTGSMPWAARELAMLISTPQMMACTMPLAYWPL